MNRSKIGYEFKVYPVGRGREIYRVFQIRADATFDELCFSILDLFDFDCDHMYEICLNNRPYDQDNLQCPRSACGHANTANTRLNDVGLTKGSKFLFHYDFGDDWKFNVSTVKVLEDFTSSVALPVKEKGKLRQY